MKLAQGTIKRGDSTGEYLGNQGFSASEIKSIKSSGARRVGRGL